MQESEFWRLLKKLDWDEAGDDEEVIEPVVSALSVMKAEEIFDFEEILAKKLFALDTKSHAKEIGKDAYANEEDFFSVDGFLYSRCVVVANGKELFDDVLANPKRFPKDMEFEAILGIAREAFERKTGEDFEYTSTTDYETFSNKAGWE